MNDAVKKTFLLKIIPPDGYSVYRVTFTRRHLVSIAAIVFALLLGAVGLHTYQLKVAEANLKALQAITARQQSQLRQIDSQADALAGELRAVQKENAAIRQLIGGDKDGKHQHAMIVVPRANGAEDFARVQARLRHLASASQATRADAARLQRLVLRVLNLRRLATIARERMIAAIPSIMPANGYVASGFGWRNNPWPEFHKGVDLAADYGATVRAAASGTVASAGWDPGGFGNKVDIDHGNGYHTWYAHLA
ncbi:MAG TPA: M23 family metallopeptidase, partial [Candidatus Acidoferrum sp.]|nr:M23 family metallopeptidase [Candidatus Acidoferrum sp.]